MAEKMAPGRKGDQDGVNIQVLLRCRPLATHEPRPTPDKEVECNELQNMVSVPNVGKTRRQFHFDRVFGSRTSQSALYEHGIQPVVREVLAGFNCTIFAYGQTGTGKTYTMEGGMRDSVDGSELSDAAGVIPRAINQIFEHVRSIGGDLNTVKCSFLELYNEEATDLLATGDGVKLTIQADPTQKGTDSVQVKGLEEVYVRSAEDIYGLLDKGSAKRRTAATLLNKQSSRSHSVFCVTVQIHELQSNGEDAIRIGKLYLVDLAGSESVFRSGATEERAKEAGSINKSLSALGRVINAIVDKTGHIPYRDSKLTRLLADSLGGRTKTCIIATISPTLSDETKNTLEYALRAKNIRNRPEVNQKVSSATHMANLSAENKRLKLELTATREKDGVWKPLETYERELEEARADKERRAELECELDAIHGRHAAEREALERELAERSAVLETTQQALAKTQAKLERAQLGLEQRDFLVAAHERAEGQLMATTHALRGQLGTAAAHLAALYAKVDAKTVLEGDNAAAVRQLQDLVGSHLEGLRAAVAGAMTAQQAKLGAVTQQLGAAAQDARDAAAALQRRTEELQAQLAAATSSAAAVLDATAGASADGFQAAQAAHAEHLRASEEAAGLASEALGAAHARLAAALQQQAQQLAAFAGEQKAEADAAASAILETIDAGGRSLLEVDTCAASWRDSLAAKQAEQQRALAEAEQATRASLASGQEQLAKTVVGLLARFVGEQRANMETAFEAARLQISVADTVNTDHAERLMQSANAVSLNLQAGRDEVASAQARAAETRQKWQQTLQSGVSSSRSCGDAVRSEAATAAEAQLQRQQDFLASAAEAAVSHEKQATAAADAGKEACTSAGEALRAGQQAWLGTAQGGLRMADAAFIAVAASADEARQLGTGLVAEHDGARTAFASGVGELIRTKYCDGIPTDDLPPRRQIAVPSEKHINALRAPAPEVALAEFRSSRPSQGSTAAEDGRDADMAAEQLSPSSDGKECALVGRKRSASGSQDAASPLKTRDPNQPDGGVTHVGTTGKRRRTEQVV